MSVLVTGGLGFIGSTLGRALVERGEKVVLFDSIMNTYRIKDIEGKVKCVQGDLKLWPEIFDVIKENKIQGIYHLGAMTSLPSEANPWRSFETNAIGTLHILEAARLLGVKKIVFASTADTYGLGVTDKIDDETIQRPINIYGCTKLTGEIFGRCYRGRYGLDFRGARISAAVMGPGVKTPATSQYNAWMVEAAALGKNYECYVTEKTKLPVIYVKDMVRAFYMLYDAPAEKIKMVSYNIGGIKPAKSAKELELAIQKQVPNFKVTYKPDPQVMNILDQQFEVAVDDSKAREEWGWKPQYQELDVLIKDFISEIQKNPERYGVR
jgi:threonine 3-dehydrogenase